MQGSMLENVRRKKPLVHCISNYVTANDCANLLLACGGAAIMADDMDEAAEIAALADGLVLNMGTPGPWRFKAMLRAGREANRRDKPVVLDPVGAGCSRVRDDWTLKLLENVRFSAIRGNASEIAFLARGRGARHGVEGEAVSDAPECAVRLARKSGAVVIVTGQRDIVTDGGQIYFVDNGHAMMGRVTGAGCMLGALTGAFLAANPGEGMRAALAAVCAMGLCGEIAHERLGPMDGNASYRNTIIDAMFNLTGDQLEGGARYEADGAAIEALCGDRPKLAGRAVHL